MHQLEKRNNKLAIELNEEKTLSSDIKERLER